MSLPPQTGHPRSGQGSNFRYPERRRGSHADEYGVRLGRSLLETTLNPHTFHITPYCWEITRRIPQVYGFTFRNGPLLGTAGAAVATSAPMVGVQYTVRPLLPQRSVTGWIDTGGPLLNPVEQYLPAGESLTALPPRQGYQVKFASVNLLETTLSPAPVVVAADMPAGEQYTTRPLGPPYAGKFWAVNLLQTTLDVPVATVTASYQPTPFDWQVARRAASLANWVSGSNLPLLTATAVVVAAMPPGEAMTARPATAQRFAPWGQQPLNIALLNNEAQVTTRAPTYAPRITAFQFNRSFALRDNTLLHAQFAAPVTADAFPPKSWPLPISDKRQALWIPSRNLVLLSAPGAAPPVFVDQPTPYDWPVIRGPIRGALTWISTPRPDVGGIPPIPPPEPDTSTILMPGPAGPHWSKKKYRELMALIAAEEEARRRQLESPAMREALAPATTAAEAAISMAQTWGVSSSDLRRLTALVESAAAVRKISEASHRAELASAHWQRVWAKLEEEEEDEIEQILLLD